MQDIPREKFGIEEVTKTLLISEKILNIKGSFQQCFHKTDVFSKEFKYKNYYFEV
jgi:hypothetical protein